MGPGPGRCHSGMQHPCRRVVELSRGVPHRKRQTAKQSFPAIPIMLEPTCTSQGPYPWLRHVGRIHSGGGDGTPSPSGLAAAVVSCWVPAT